MKYFLDLKQTGWFLLFAAFFMSVGNVATAQQGHYLGKEKPVSSDFLLSQAAQTDFRGNIAALVYNDVKNDYYALDLNRIDSRYVKIRILEETYKNKKIVNIESNPDGRYFLFLVNKTLGVKEAEVLSFLEQIKTLTMREEKKLSGEELTAWFARHDKYSSKH